MEQAISRPARGLRRKPTRAGRRQASKAPQTSARFLLGRDQGSRCNLVWAREDHSQRAAHFRGATFSFSGHLPPKLNWQASKRASSILYSQQGGNCAGS